MELYTNARFISCEKENRIYTAMAVKGGHIVWLGDESSIPPRYGKAKRVDLGGATVTPAFGDTHMHFGSLCVFENTFYLMDVKNFAEAKAAVRRYADSHRKNKVLMGYGCTANTVAEHRLPEKRDLDDWTERPLMVMKYDGHAAVCNSAMLALLSDKVKSDPGCNTETGWLYQSAFYNGVNEATAYIPTMDIIRGLSGGAEYLASVGIGLVHTVEGVGFANDLDIDMIKILAPGLPQAFRIFFQTMDLKAVKKHGFKRVGGCFKLALDGCFGSEDAALKEPYANDPNNYGVLNYPQERVNEFAIGANREGWQITMHAIGDAAVEQCITAYEAAYADKPWDDARHVMIHVCLASEEQLKRAAKIKLCIAAQSPFIYWKQEPDEYLCSVLGRERTDRLNALGTMHRLGLVVGDGSDGPCTRPKPLYGMACSVNHPNPDERISRLDALRMITANPAYMSHEENKRGTLAPVGGCFKLALDGCFGSEDAALKEPYANDPNNYGVLNYPQERVNEFAIGANREGWQITMHAIGDAAVEQCITAYEAAYADKPWDDARHVMIHVCLASEEQLKRAAKIKLCIAAQSPFIYWKQEPDEYLCSVLGRERTDRLNALGTMHRLGLVVGDGSDGPCTRPKPLYGMACSVNHPNPDERISRLDALRMITANPAYMSHEENKRGTLAPGMIADFVVLGDDPLTAEDIAGIEVKALYLHGKKHVAKKIGVAGLLARAIIKRITQREYI